MIRSPQSAQAGDVLMRSFSRELDVHVSSCTFPSRIELVRCCRNFVKDMKLLIVESRGTRDIEAIIACISKIRYLSVRLATSNLRDWMNVDVKAVLIKQPWDEAHLCLFIAECYLRVCCADAFSEVETVEMPSPNNPELREVEERWKAIEREEITSARDELTPGIQPMNLKSLVREIALTAGKTIVRHKYQAAISVAFENTVESRMDDTVYASFDKKRLTREAVRLLEQASVHDAARCISDATIASFEDTTWRSDDRVISAITVERWFAHCVDKEANNNLLLALDQWGAATFLDPIDPLIAAGEKGGCPEEHKNTAAAWALSCKVTADEYVDYAKRIKDNKNFTDNVYLCFSHTLKQHQGFDWLEKCFVCRLDPLASLRKLEEYAKQTSVNVVPIIVQREEGHCILVYKSSHTQKLCRVAYQTPFEGVAGWLCCVRDHLGGLYGRKKRVADIIERLQRATADRPGAGEKNTPFGGTITEINA